jgi:hemolysin III
MKATERISFYSHLAGSFLFVPGTFLLLFLSRKAWPLMTVSAIYGLSVIFLFSASSLYHYFKKQEGEISLWRKLDHFAIFVMIAGTYTPVTYVYLTGWLRAGILIFQWSLVFAGFFFKFFYLKAPRWIYTAIYLLMGWSAIFTIKPLFAAMTPLSIFLLFAGGVSFTIGAVFYMLKKPVCSPGFGFHEIFHFFILAGGVFHYILVLLAVIQL